MGTGVRRGQLIIILGFHMLVRGAYGHVNVGLLQANDAERLELRRSRLEMSKLGGSGGQRWAPR